MPGKHLTPRDKSNILYLYYTKNLTQQQIAGRMNIAQATVGRILKQAKSEAQLPDNRVLVRKPVPICEICRKELKRKQAGARYPHPAEMYRDEHGSLIPVKRIICIECNKAGWSFKPDGEVYKRTD